MSPSGLDNFKKSGHTTIMVKIPAEQLALSIRPIGVIRTTMRTKFDSPHQPINSDKDRSIIELFPGHGFDVALRDLAKFDRIWLLWWFHRNTTWRPLVLPPRGNAVRRGVFATRSPHRPNPIGITAVPLISVSKLSITVGNTDLIDGTPILDIKPYIPNVDAFPEASLGWITDVEQQLLEPCRYTITYAPLALTQLQWLQDTWEIQFVDRVAEILQRDPTIHRTRRIRKWKDDQLQMGCGGWRVIFMVTDLNVEVLKIVPGYPDSLLFETSADNIPDHQAQIAFKTLWPDEERNSTSGASKD